MAKDDLFSINPNVAAVESAIGRIRPDPKPTKKQDTPATKPAKGASKSCAKNAKQETTTPKRRPPRIVQANPEKNVRVVKDSSATVTKELKELKQQAAQLSKRLERLSKQATKLGQHAKVLK